MLLACCRWYQQQPASVHPKCWRGQLPGQLVGRQGEVCSFHVCGTLLLLVTAQEAAEGVAEEVLQ